jgi:hypothetical protein
VWHDHPGVDVDVHFALTLAAMARAIARARSGLTGPPYQPSLHIAWRCGPVAGSASLLFTSEVDHSKSLPWVHLRQESGRRVGRVMSGSALSMRWPSPHLSKVTFVNSVPAWHMQASSAPRPHTACLVCVSEAVLVRVVAMAKAMQAVFPDALTPLAECDPEVFALIQEEKARQWCVQGVRGCMAGCVGGSGIWSWRRHQGGGL